MSAALPPGVRDIEIRYIAPVYLAAERVRFRYRLEGYDADWSRETAERSALYPRLPPGKYRFRVMGARAGGEWREVEAPLMVVMNPWWWETLWFRVFLLAAFAVVVGLAVRGVVRRRWRARMRARELETQVERERMRISRDIHDDVGFGLAEVAMLAEMLKEQADCSLVASFATGEKALESLPAARPDVVIMDINLPGISGVECVKRLSRLLPQVQIVMLTVYQDTDTIFKALAAGAHGYLIKPVSPEELLCSLRQLYSGGAPMTGVIARKVVEAFRQPETDAKDRAEAGLAPREIEVLEALSKGLSYKEIAERLSVSRTTVDTYIQRIYQKLHVHSRSEAVASYLGL